MKPVWIRLISALICFVLALSCFAGCKPNRDNDSVSSDGAPSDSAVEPTDSSEPEPTAEEPESSEIPEDDTWEVPTEEPVAEEDDLIRMNAQIKNLTPLSTRYMGSGTGVYYCYTFMNDQYGRVCTDQMAKVEMDRLQNMGIHTVRSMFKFLWARDESAPDGWNWESDDMKAVYKWLTEMEKRDIDVMLNPWSFGHLTTGNASISDTPYFNTGDFTENSKRWCDAVAELYRQLYARGHNNVKYLVLFTEPIYANEENIELQYDQYVENAKRLHNVLSAAGLRRRITVMGPNRSDADTRLLKQLSAEADEAIDIYSQHQYLSAADLTADTYSADALGKWGLLAQEVRSSGITKPFWVDEWNIQDYSKTKAGYSNVGFDDPMRGVQQAVGIITGMNLGIDNMMLWALADQQWPNQRNTGLSSGFYDGVSKHGLFNNIQITMTPKAQYYSYSLLSKYTGRGGGTTYAGVPEDEYYGIYIGCVKTSDGDWTIIAVNNNIEDARLTVDIEASLGGVKLFRHQYVANEVQANIAAQIIPANKTFQNVTTAFTDILRGNSVAVYTTIKG